MRLAGADMYKILICLFAVSSALVSAEPSNSARVIGEAYDLSGQKLKYREFHYYSDDELTHQVVYRDSDEKLMVEKTIDYRSGFTTPEFSQSHSQTPHDISISWYEDGLKISNSESTNIITVKKPLVIDAGFDHFIREHWLELTSGNTLHFYFPLPKRATLAKLRVKQSTCSYKTDTDSCFSLEVSNWLLRLLVDPIELGYAVDTRTLMRYRGLSNIEDDQGQGLVVDIRYRYAENPETCKTNCVSSVTTF